MCGDGILHRNSQKCYIPTKSRNIATVNKSNCYYWQDQKKVKTNWKLLPWSKAQKSTFFHTNQPADEISWPVSCWYWGKQRFLDSYLPHVSRRDVVQIQTLEWSFCRIPRRDESSLVWLHSAMKPFGNYNLILGFIIQPEILKMLCFCSWWKHVTWASWQNCKVAFMFHY